MRDPQTERVLPGKWEFEWMAGDVRFYVSDLNIRYPDVRILLATPIGSRYLDNNDQVHQLSRVEDFNLCNTSFFGLKPTYEAVVGHVRYAVDTQPLSINPYDLRDQPVDSKIHDKKLRTSTHRAFSRIANLEISETFSRLQHERLQFVLKTVFQEAEAER